MMNALPNPITGWRRVFGWIYLVAQQFAIPFLMVLIVIFLGLPYSDLWLNFAFFALNFLVVAAVFGPFLCREIRTLGKNFWSNAGTCVIGYVIYWASTLLLSIFIALYFPDFYNANDANIESMAGKSYWVMFVGTVLLVPTVEEVLYRGIIYGSFSRRSPVIGYILSTVLFSAIHVVGYIGSQTPVYLLISFLQYVPAGLCLSWAYAKSGTIFVPILIHTAVNLLGMLAMR